MNAQSPESLLRDIVAAYGLGELRGFERAGGTAQSSKWSLETSQGRYFVRGRPSEFIGDAYTKFDHACMKRMYALGLPVPDVLTQANGTTWIDQPSGRFEVLTLLDGELFDPDKPGEHEAVGEFLARFHTVDFYPPGKEGFLREEHSDFVWPYFEVTASWPGAAEHQADLDRLREELGRVRETLDTGFYDTLPHTLAHGDFHPGNFRFSGGKVTAAYDFDYLSRQARMRDMSDAIMFYASNRRTPFNPSDIRSLTQSMMPDLARSALILRAYQSVAPPLNDDEWRALPWLIRSRWLQIRLRGARKVPPEQKLAYVLNELFELPQWLDERGDEFFDQLRRQTIGSA